MILQLRVVDERFQLYCSINWCFMHQSTIGLFGEHVVKSTIYRIQTTLRNDSYTNGKTKDGGRKQLISEAALEAVWARLQRRLGCFQSSFAGFQLTSKYAAHFRNVFINGKGTFTASRIELLMIALIFVIRDLIRPEIELIQRAIKDGKVDTDEDGNLPVPPEDPCPDIIQALAIFLDWYMLARVLLFPLDMAPELQRRAFAMKEELQRVFPDKSGETARWNFPKMHSVNHKASEIATSASTLFTDTSMLEAGHKPNIKDLSGNSNGKDQFMIISKFHDRAACLSKLKQATNRHGKFLARGNESDSGSSSENHDEDEDDDILTDPHTSRPCEMAARMPLWEMTGDVKALRREPFSLGANGKGLQRIVLAACKPGAPASSQAHHKSKVSSGNKFLYNHAEEYPDLKFLSAQLGHFAYEYLGESLGLEDLPEADRDVNGVLDRCLVKESDGAGAITFGGLAIRSENHKGVVPHWCVCVPDPFPATNFSDEILRSPLDNLACLLSDFITHVWTQDAVLTIPGRPEWPDSGSSFDGSNESHRDQMWICRVALFFRCTFQRPGQGQHPRIPCVLALVNRLRECTVPEARK